MKSKQRQAQINRLVDEKGYLSVGELSKWFHVSEMTIRRDLEELASTNRIQRTFGGAAPVKPAQVIETRDVALGLNDKAIDLLAFQADVLVAASLHPRHADLLRESINKRGIPVISESFQQPYTVSCVSIDDYKAGVEIGNWAANYLLQRPELLPPGGKVTVLDLTYIYSNTTSRSRGFSDGLRAILPVSPDILSLNANSQTHLAFQLTQDALSVNPNIQIIFCINDTTALGALEACQNLHLNTNKIQVIPFGLEGNIMKNALMEDSYIKAGLAMFPELVGPACVEAAISAYNRQPMPEVIHTPHRVLTRDTLQEYYTQRGDNWKICWDAVRRKISPQFDFEKERRHIGNLPACIGIIRPFREHEWYQNLLTAMKEYARYYQIEIQGIDVEQTIKDEIDSRQRSIAQRAVQEIQAGDVILMDGSPITQYMAESLTDRTNITVITNSLHVFDILRKNNKIILFLTGGVLRSSSMTLVGPTAESTLKDMRADKLFLSATGVSLNFGISHTTVAEVTMKQAMIRSSRQVILLADSTCFGQESVLQVAPLRSVQTIITDDGLVASIRLQLNQLGIHVIVA